MIHLYNICSKPMLNAPKMFKKKNASKSRETAIVQIYFRPVVSTELLTGPGENNTTISKAVTRKSGEGGFETTPESQQEPTSGH